MPFAYSLALFLVTFIGGSAPLWVKRLNDDAMQYLLAFSGAFLLSMTMLHLLPETIGGTEINNGVCWGGSFEVLQDMPEEEAVNDIRLFVGYSGWSPGQLERELKEGSWLIADVSQEVIFDTEPEQVWKRAIESLGNKYSYLQHMPTDPGLN